MQVLLMGIHHLYDHSTELSDYLKRTNGLHDSLFTSLPALLQPGMLHLMSM